jgi:acyl carrier protein
MERSEIERTIIEVIHSQKTLPEDAVTASATLAEAGIDSLDALNILFELEEKFAISVPDQEARSIRSVGDLTRIVETLLAQKNLS